MPIRLRGSGGGGSAPVADPKETLNILNGVLSCAWDKTSYSPKLLEIYENSQVKFNVDSDNPLVLAFANGWDDLDRPAQVVKRLAVAPSNIDLSAKANCYVQIVAKVINDELVITTHDIYDPSVSTPDVNILPTFTQAGTVDGWTLSSAGSFSGSPYYISDGSTAGLVRATSGTGYVYLTSALPTMLSGVSVWGANNGAFNFNVSVSMEGSVWDVILNATMGGWTWQNKIISDPKSLIPVRFFRVGIVAGTYAQMGEIYFFERRSAIFNIVSNSAKDPQGNNTYWINLGYATVDASGNITALTHYTDLRNNYPGGMRVAA